MDSIKFVLAIAIAVIFSSSVNAYKYDEYHNKANANVAPTTFDISSNCECSTYSCGCCVHISEIVSGLVCTNISYLPNDYGVSVVITFNNYTLINETISARNPPPICIGIPEFKHIFAKLCLQLYNLNFEHKTFSGCVAIKILAFHFSKTIKIRCFHLPNKINKNSNLNGKINTAIVKIYEYKNYKIDYDAIKKLPTVRII